MHGILVYVYLYSRRLEFDCEVQVKINFEPSDLNNGKVARVRT